METINLDSFVLPGNRLGTFRATDYRRAWPGAAGEIEIALCYQRENTVVQFGHALDNPGGVLWRRQKAIDGTAPWSDWIEDMGQGGVSDGNNAKVSRCKMEDGSFTVWLPSWHKVNVSGCDGVLLMHDGAGGCDVMSTGVTEYETTGFVSQSYDQWVCYGVSRDGGPVMEVGRQQVKGAEQFVYYRAQFYSIEGTHLDYFVSSTFQWQATVWRDIQMSAVQG